MVVSTAAFAFLHHLSAFTLVCAIAIECILLRDELTIERARTLLRTDAIAGISAGVLIVVGLLRVFVFEKGGAFYFHNAFFIAKFVVFFLVALLTLYPTVTFLSWRKALQRGQRPFVEPEKIRRIRRLLKLELIGIVIIVFCAAFMARGIGQLS